MESLNSNFQERAASVATNARQSKRKLHGGFERAFVTLFDQDFQSLTRSMFLNLDQLGKQLDKEEYQDIGSFDAFRYFIAYTKIEVPLFQATLIQYMESLRESILEKEKHKQEKDKRMSDRMMQSKERKDNSSKALDVGLVVTESNETESERHVLSSRSGNDTHIDNADINSVSDKQPMAEVQLSAKHNILANEQQHYVQSEFVYDTYLLEKVDRNTTPESLDMSRRGGEIDQNADAKKFKNTDLKAQIQEKVFANVVLKNKLRKFKGNSVDTKFAKTSILGKPVPPRNQSVVRQPNAFKSERTNFSKPWFDSQVDVNNVLSKPFTPHYFLKVGESAPAKPHHVNAPSSSRNSKKESYDSNPVFILKASIPPKRKLDLTTGIYFLGYGLFYDHTKQGGRSRCIPDSVHSLLLILQESSKSTQERIDGLRGKLRQHQHHQSHKLKSHIKKVNEELGKVHWWEIVRGRLPDAAKDHMIRRMML
nr:hypothetical protein [Tanacetum cinerariifolium]